MHPSKPTIRQSEVQHVAGLTWSAVGVLVAAAIVYVLLISIPAIRTGGV